MKKLLLQLGIIGILSFSNQAQAVTIVDTGAGGADSGWTFANQPKEYLAAKFTLSQAYSLTSIYGWMRTFSTANAGTVAISIYGDAGTDVPNVADPKYNQTFSVTSSTSNWQGLSGLNWNLSPASYWVAFELPADSTFAGMMVKTTLNPLGDEAFKDSTGWHPYDDLNIGVQINGDASAPNPAAVPEPASMSLLGLGLLGLLGFGKRRK